MQKNIIHIFGTNSAWVEHDKNFLVRHFRDKYGAESVEICPLENDEKLRGYIAKIQNIWLFETSRMFVFFGGKEKTSKSKNPPAGFEAMLDEIIPTLSEKDFLLFYNIEAGEEGLKKWLEKHATPRERNFSWVASNWAKLYNIPENLAAKILNRYQNAEKLRDKRTPENPFLGHNVATTMMQIGILHEAGETITDEIIEVFSFEYSGVKIFDFIDAILALDIKKALMLSQKIQQHTTSSTEMNMFWGSFLGNLRKNLYILYLKEQGHTKHQILEILSGISPYMVDKILKSKINKKQLARFTQKMQDAIIAYKSGKWMKKNILWQFLEIDTGILDLKK